MTVGQHKFYCGFVKGPIFDWLGEPVFSGWSDGATLLFVDLQPEANWDHRCIYIAYHKNGGSGVHFRTCPPAESIELTELRPLVVNGILDLPGMPSFIRLPEPPERLTAILNVLVPPAGDLAAQFELYVRLSALPEELRAQVLAYVQKRYGWGIDEDEG